MLASVRWLNRLLEPPTLTPDEAEAVLIHAGFPIEERDPIRGGWEAGGDECLDVEITSNRGDCMSHVGLAREIAAATGRRLALPGIPFDIHEGPSGGGGERIETLTSVDNRAPEACPVFTARLIRGITVGPSPRWLVELLEAVGQRSINNVVDASNYVLFELGNPTHTFDLSALNERRLVVRYAQEGEELTTLEGDKRKLKADELVVADATRAVSLAGVIGGLETSVTEKTADILLEAATWDPPTIRRAARRHQIITDAGKRFERVVDARTVDYAGARVASLILETGGGTLVSGSISEGREAEAARVVEMRPARCRQILGVEIETQEMGRLLESLEVGTEVVGAAGGGGERLRCVIPHHRAHDLTREVDLIEEVARVHGFERFQVRERIEVSAAAPQDERRAMRLAGDILCGLGFFETVTFSFLTEEEAALFLPVGLGALKIDEARRGAEPALRPSVVPSLLRCRKLNQDAGVRLEGGIRLFEIASVYAEGEGGETVENVNIALVMDAEEEQEGVRRLRGAVEALATAMAGPEATVEARAAGAWCGALRDDAHAHLFLDGKPIGYLGLISDAARKRYDIEGPVAVGEVNAPALLGLFPPKALAHALPAFPAIERDLSVVVSEETPWAQVRSAIETQALEKLVGLAFVGTYQGKQVGAGKKSVTLRLRFQDPERTLRHEEVDPQVDRAVGALEREVGAELRAG